MYFKYELIYIFRFYLKWNAWNLNLWKKNTSTINSPSIEKPPWYIQEILKTWMDSWSEKWRFIFLPLFEALNKVGSQCHSSGCTPWSFPYIFFYGFGRIFLERLSKNNADFKRISLKKGWLHPASEVMKVSSITVRGQFIFHKTVFIPHWCQVWN